MITIREMTVNDCAVCENIYYRAFEFPDSIKKLYNLPNYLTQFINDENRYAYCILKNDEIIGFIAASKNPDVMNGYTIYIDYVVVDPAHQKNGYGTEAFKKFMSLFPSLVTLKLMTEKSRPAYDMYKALGFIDIADLDSAVMEYSLLMNAYREYMKNHENKE